MRGQGRRVGVVVTARRGWREKSAEGGKHLLVTSAPAQTSAIGGDEEGVGHEDNGVSEGRCGVGRENR